MSGYNKRYFEKSFLIIEIEIFEMTSSGKFVLCLAVLFCVVQAIAARPRIDGNFLENVQFDLSKKCTSLERDIEKETMNVRHKLTKESLKLSKKASKEGALECIESAKIQAEEQLEEKSLEIAENVQEMKDSLETALQPEVPLQEIMAYRNSFKNKLSLYKKTGKNDLKAILNGFSAAGKACLV